MYDTTRKRIIKTKGSTAMLFQNSDLRSAQLLLRDFTVYPSAFLTQSDSKITKHYYAGTKRIASRIEIKTATEPRLSLDMELKAKQESDLEAIAKKLDCKEYKYEFNQFEAEVEDDDTIALRAEVPSPVFFYHPDHLGSSTVISNSTGAMHQYFFNLPFGETMIEGCNNTSYQLNYKFNGKELDAESNMYYYGARYYDPRISVWMSVDQMWAGAINFSPYVYCDNSPIVMVDPDGNYSRVGAWIRNKLWHGGGISKTNGEWGVNFAGKDIEGVDEIVHQTSGSKRWFREDYVDAWKSNHDFAQTLRESGIEYSYTNNAKEAALSQLKIATEVLLPNPLVKGVTNLVNAGKNAAKRSTNFLKPLELGSTAKTEAANLTQQLAMKEVLSNPAAGHIIQSMKPLTDPRWLGWRKMQYEHIGLDGSKTIVHYNGKWVDGILQAVDDFKFK